MSKNIFQHIDTDGGLGLHPPFYESVYLKNHMSFEQDWAKFSPVQETSYSSHGLMSASIAMQLYAA